MAAFKGGAKAAHMASGAVSRGSLLSAAQLFFH